MGREQSHARPELTQTVTKHDRKCQERRLSDDVRNGILLRKALKMQGVMRTERLTLVISGDGEASAKIAGIGSLRPRFETDLKN